MLLRNLQLPSFSSSSLTFAFVCHPAPAKTKFPQQTSLRGQPEAAGPEGSGMVQPPGRWCLQVQRVRFVGDICPMTAREMCLRLKSQPLNPEDSTGEEGAAAQTQALWVSKAAGKGDQLEKSQRLIVPAESQARCPKPSISRGKSRAKRPLAVGNTDQRASVPGSSSPRSRQRSARPRHPELQLPGAPLGNMLRNTVCFKAQAQGMQAFTLPENTAHG